MAVIVIRGNARAAWLTGLARLCARARDMARRALACAAAAVMIGAVGAALLQLAAEDRELPGSDRRRRDHRDHRGPASCAVPVPARPGQAPGRPGEPAASRGRPHAIRPGIGLVPIKALAIQVWPFCAARSACLWRVFGSEVFSATFS